MAKCLDLHFRIQIESIFGLMEGGVEGKIRFHQHMCCDMKQGPSHSYRRRPQQFPRLGQYVRSGNSTRWGNIGGDWVNIGWGGVRR